MRHSKKPAEHRELAIEHVRSLLAQAGARKEKALADRYAEIAMRVAMKFKLRLPPELKRRICKHCHHYLRQGENCRVRISRGKVVLYCLDCRRFMRFPYHQEARKKANSASPRPKST